ncbi:lipoprotein [Streptomyces sp. NPDC059582]|uniref:lipoprotein n=1 Tax=Streptomyces sp. NPDC059582 TaxID=3346875 RepID=UPI0036B39599
MRIGAGTAWRGLAQALVLVGALTACGQGEDGEQDAKASARPSVTATAERGGTVGADGSACELPVTFDIARNWKAEAVESDADGSGGSATDDALEALLHQGPVTTVCEIDAKPAGHIGFLRVWTGAAGDADARGVLEAFVTAEGQVSGQKYRTFDADGLAGAEVEYTYTNKVLDESKKEHALAVVTSDGPVVLHLGGLDTEEHQQMLPAYELAKRTLRAA